MSQYSGALSDSGWEGFTMLEWECPSPEFSEAYCMDGGEEGGGNGCASREQSATHDKTCMEAEGGSSVVTIL